MVAEFRDCDKIIKGDESRPATNFEDYDKPPKEALLLLKLSVLDKMIPEVRNAILSSTLRASLKGKYQTSEKSRVLYLKNMLCSVKLQEGGSLSEHLLWMEDLRDQLFSINKMVDDDDMVALVLNSLPSSYESCVEALHLMAESETLTFDKVSSYLLQKERRQTQVQEFTSGQSESAFAAQSKGKCKRQAETSSFSPKYQVKCYYCHKLCHVKKDCRKRLNALKKQKGQAQVATVEHESEEEYALMASCTDNGSPTRCWFFDFEALWHFTCQKDWYVNFNSRSSDSVTLEDGRSHAIEGIGDVCIMLNNNTRLLVKNVRYVPNMYKSLLSFSQLIDKPNISVNFSGKQCIVSDIKQNKVVTLGIGHGGLYRLVDPATVNLHALVVEGNISVLWHERYGHLKRKQKWKPFPSESDWRAKGLLDLVHADLCEPLWKIPTVLGARYVLLLVDDYSRKMWVYVLKKKSDCFASFVKFKASVENQTDRRIKTLRSDNEVTTQPATTSSVQRRPKWFYSTIQDLRKEELSPLLDGRSRRTGKKIDYFEHTQFALASDLLHIHEPHKYFEARGIPEWEIAMQLEYDALIKNNIWKLVPLPPGKHTIGYKWVYKIKCKADGTLDKYKARFVAKGFSQQEGTNYEETVSPTVKMVTFQLPLSFATQFGLKVYQMDVKSAFLNGDLEEEVYMTQPEGFRARGSEHLVCRLIKSLYGLKQAPRAWYIKIDKHLRDSSFTRSHFDPNLYVKSNDDDIVILIVYVDDLAIIGSGDAAIHKVKSDLCATFDMTDLGLLHYFLGVEFGQLDHLIFISQVKYASNLLQKFQMYDCNSSSTPMEVGLKLSAHDDSPPVDEPLYRQLVGSLIYLTTTQPDLCFAVSYLTWFLYKPKLIHWGEAKRVLRYVKGTLDFGILYQRVVDFRLIGYTDSDWGGSALAKMVTHFVGVHSRLCLDEAEVADHIVGLTRSLAECQFRQKLTHLSISANGSFVPKDYPTKHVINKSVWLKALVAIPRIPPKCAVAIAKKYPTMRSLLNVYLDTGRT
ncbi:hypothetical protein KI387_023588, partial [Taxus chinensis]